MMTKMMSMVIAGIMVVVGLLISFVVLPPVIIALFPTAIAGIVTLSTLPNFTFAALFTSAGLFPLMLSVAMFLLMFSVVIVGVTYVISMVDKKGGR